DHRCPSAPRPVPGLRPEHRGGRSHGGARPERRRRGHRPALPGCARPRGGTRPHRRPGAAAPRSHLRDHEHVPPLRPGGLSRGGAPLRRGTRLRRAEDPHDRPRGQPAHPRRAGRLPHRRRARGAGDDPHGAGRAARAPRPNPPRVPGVPRDDVHPGAQRPHHLRPGGFRRRPGAHEHRAGHLLECPRRHQVVYRGARPRPGDDGQRFAPQPRRRTGQVSRPRPRRRDARAGAGRYRARGVPPASVCGARGACDWPRPGNRALGSPDV
ncbi:MAG: Uncharacterized protein AVDCRST_MAG18-3910, partial [uncultured Thermomicrobiales bacterium]